MSEVTMNLKTWRERAAFGLALLAFATTSLAQVDQPADQFTPPATQPAESDEDAKKPAPKSLDDLLGIDEQEQDKGAGEAANRESEEELQRELSEEKIADAFAVALHKMSLSADMLDTQFDPGLGTQRVQEDILAKLAQLIDQAKKQQSNSSSSSSSSQQQQARNNPKNNPGQQQQNKPAQSEQRAQQSSESQEGDAPPMQEGDINTVMEEEAAEWGNLPQRVRDMLQQGRRDKFSSLYQQLTEKYYQRLAEESSP